MGTSREERIVEGPAGTVERGPAASAQHVPGREGAAPRSRSARWIALGAALVLVLSVAADPVGVGRFALGFAYRGPLVDAEAWRAFARGNSDLFGPLAPGASLAVVEDPRDSTGVLFTRTDAGMEVERSHFLRLRAPEILLVMDPPTAAAAQALRAERDGNAFWDGLKNLARTERLVAHRRAPPGELERLGLSAFLASIDVDS